jgi:thiol:disulfide interchange protein DsbA
VDFGRRRFVLLTAGALLADQRAFAIDLMEEVDYRVIAQQPLADPTRVEVIEFFYYGCHWCNALQSHLEQWLPSKPADVVFRLQPAIRNTRWLPLTKLFYVLEAQGQLGRLHARVFRAYHHDAVNFDDESRMTAWLVEQGLARDEVERLLRSDEVLTKVEAARAATYAYEVDSTPSMVVDGRYLTSSGMVGGVGMLMPVTDALIALARDDRRAPR